MKKRLIDIILRTNGDYSKESISRRSSRGDKVRRSLNSPFMRQQQQKIEKENKQQAVRIISAKPTLNSSRGHHGLPKNRVLRNSINSIYQPLAGGLSPKMKPKRLQKVLAPCLSVNQLKINKAYLSLMKHPLSANFSRPNVTMYQSQADFGQVQHPQLSIALP